jgi:hypothetical protein
VVSRHPDHEALKLAKDSTPIDYPKPDGVTSFDLPTSLYRSGDDGTCRFKNNCMLFCSLAHCDALLGACLCRQSPQHQLSVSSPARWHIAVLYWLPRSRGGGACRGTQSD